MTLSTTITLRRVCVFSGSRPGTRPVYEREARALGTLMARQGLGLVYGGSSVGLMGAIADAVLAAGGEVVGVIPDALVAREVAKLELTDLRVVGSMHERKALMAELADAFVALPGGLGTFEELFEIITWAQLGIHAKPVGLLNVEGYYDPLVTLVHHAIEEGFVRPEHAELFVVRSDPESLLEGLYSHQPPDLGPKWLEKSET